MGRWLDTGTRYTVVQGEDWWIDLYRDENAQVVTVNPGAGSPTGTFTLTFRGRTTVEIDIGAAAADVQAALEALSTVGTGNVAVSGSAGGPWTVTWLRHLDELPPTQTQPLLTATTTFDTADSSVSVGAVPHDVTGYTAEATLGDVPGPSSLGTYASVTDTPGTDGEVDMTDAATGHVIVKIKESTTAGLTFTQQAQLDVQLITAGGIKEHWVSAPVRLRLSVL